MNASVILGHPCRASFNHAIADMVVHTLRAAGHTVWYHDLYEEEFDPVATCAEIPKDGPLDPVIRRRVRFEQQRHVRILFRGGGERGQH